MAFFLLASHVDRARLFECLVSEERREKPETRRPASHLRNSSFLSSSSSSWEFSAEWRGREPKRDHAPSLRRAQDEEATELYGQERETEEEEAQEDVEKERDEEKMMRRRNRNQRKMDKREVDGGKENEPMSMFSPEGR